MKNNYLSQLTKQIEQTQNPNKDNQNNNAYSTYNIKQYNLTRLGNKYSSYLSRANLPTLPEEYINAGIIPNILDTSEAYNRRYNAYLEEQERLRKEEMKRKAEDQGILQPIINTNLKAAGNFLLGIVEGFSDLVDLGINLFTDEDDYTNPVTDLIQEGYEWLDETLPVYRFTDDPMDLTDPTWWLEAYANIAKSASLLIPSSAATKGLGKLGKLGKLDKLSYTTAKYVQKVPLLTKINPGKVSKVINTGAEIMTTATFSRLMESRMEGREVYNQSKQLTLDALSTSSKEDKLRIIDKISKYSNLSDEEKLLLTNEEIAKALAQESADNTFSNQMNLVLMDAVQLYAIGSLWKGLSKASPNTKVKIANRNARNAIGKTVDINGKVIQHEVRNINWKNRIAETGRYFKEHPFKATRDLLGSLELTEGLEEGIQFYINERSVDMTKEIIYNDFTPRTLNSILKDDEMWNAVVQGVFGGIGMKFVGNKYGNWRNKRAAKKDLKEGRITQQEFEDRVLNFDKKRINEIDGRAKLFDKFEAEMQEINAGKNPGKYYRDQTTGEWKIVDGELKQVELSPEEIEMLKDMHTRDFIQELSMRAIRTGNYELLEEMMGTREIHERLKSMGLFNNDDAKITENVKKEMKSVYKEYTKNLGEILNYCDPDSDEIAHLIASTLTRDGITLNNNKEVISQLNKLINDATNDGNKNIIADYSDLYFRNQLYYRLKNLKKTLETLDKEGIGNLAYQEELKQYDKLSQIISEKYEYEHADQFLEIYTPQTLNHLSEQLNDQLNKFIQSRATRELNNLFIQSNTPTTKSDFKVLYDSFAFTADKYVSKRFEKAMTTIEEAINSVTTIEELENVIHTIKDGFRGNAKLDKAAREILYGYNAGFRNTLNERIDKAIQNKRDSFKIMNNTQNEVKKTSDATITTTNPTAEEILKEEKQKTKDDKKQEDNNDEISI